jgi:predicted nucleic acid-binding protein
VFADTFYWIALAHPAYSWHEKARSVSGSLGTFLIITSDEVLIEFLAFFGKKGPVFRKKAVDLVRNIFNNPNIKVIPQTRTSFLEGVNLYEQRPDKEYSLTDCISMNTMKSENLVEVLTHDNHFTQEGFSILLND